MGSNWYIISKLAMYGHDTVNDDEQDQLLPIRRVVNPLEKQKQDKNRLGDQGTGLGDTRDFIEMYDEMQHESLLDQYDEGAVQNSTALQSAPLDTITDEPMNQGDAEYQNDPIGSHSPIGENAQTLRKAEEPWADNKPNRLPGNGGLPPAPKHFPRNRRSSLMSPLEAAWAYQVKKGRTK